jgi:hypothetical protein
MIDGENNVITYRIGERDIWISFLPSAVLDMALTARMCVVACEDGTVLTYSLAGRQ